MSIFLVFMTIAVATRTRIASMLVNVIIRRTIPGLVAIEDALIRTTRETPRRFLAIMSAEFAAQGFLGLELWALLASLNLPCPLARAALMEGVMKFMSAGAFFVPGQAGVAEGSYAVIFSVFGLPAAAGVTLSIARRVRTLGTALVGVVALILQIAEVQFRESPSSSRCRQCEGVRRRGSGHEPKAARVVVGSMTKAASAVPIATVTNSTAMAW